MTRWLGNLAVVVALAAPMAVFAAPLSAPHDAAYADANCKDCHTMYVKNVNGNNDYSPGCVACHNSTATVNNTSLGFPWAEADQATPGAGGSQHNWSGSALNPQVGAALPSSAVIQSKLVDGKLQCSTCHDVHYDSPKFAPNSRHTSFKLGEAKTPVGDTSTGTLTLVAAATAGAKGFRVQIVQAAADGLSGQFVISHDAQLTTSTWLKWDTGTNAWVTGTVAGPGRPFTTGTDVTKDVALDDPAVKVRFGAGVKVGDYWDFYIGYPNLRASNVADAFCQMCHAERFMDHVKASGKDPGYAPNGVRKFSHPVEVKMNANGKAYDYTVATMLDADGSVQAGGTETRASNNLVLASVDANPDNAVVRCTTCHAVHNADSNSLTEDVR